jgi:ferritin
MVSAKIQDAINEQISTEMYSAYVYLAMSAYFERSNLPGCAHWMRLQYQEESGHALKLFDYLLNREGTVVLQAIKQPSEGFSSPLKVFETALKHEKHVTAMINKLYALAQKESDYPTQVELQWFITEQVEEEKNASGIVEQLKMIGENRVALLMLDRQLAARTGG